MSPVLYFALLSEPILTCAFTLLFAGVVVGWWQRAAVILTPTAIRFRGLVGRPVEVSLIGAKRVSRELVSGESGDYLIPRLEFVVGGSLCLPGFLSGTVLIARMEEIIAERAKADGGVGCGPGVRPTKSLQ